MVKKFFYSFLFFIIVSVNGAISEENIYFVEKVRCFAESTSSADAKNVAIEKAEREAIKILFDRLKINRENVKFITSEILARTIDSIRISDEVLTDVKYSSNIDVYFNKEFINYYLNQYNIKNGEIIEKKYLYIPILKVGDNYYNLLNNIWREDIVSNTERINSDIFDISNNFIVLNQNPANDVLINKKSIENPRYDDFLGVLKEHQNANVLVFSIAEYIKDGDNITVQMKEITADNNIIETKLNIFNKENYSYEAFMDNAASKLLQYFIKKNILKKEDKKVDNKSNNNSKEIKACVLQSDISNVVFIKNMLNTLSFIKSFRTDFQTTKETCFDIEINTDHEKLYSLFKESGVLVQFKEGIYYLTYIGL